MPFFRYNPHLLTCDDIIKQFVVRQEELKRLLDHCEQFKQGTSNRPVLVSGTRGTGKTTLLRRLFCEPNFFGDIRVVRLPEEQYNIRKLYALWNSVYRDITGEQISPQYTGGLSGKAIASFARLKKLMLESQSKCIIIIENFEDMVKCFADVEVQMLMDRVNEEKWMLLICGSARLLQERVAFPSELLSTFLPIELHSLSLEEVKSLAESLTKQTYSNDTKSLIAVNPGKFEALLRLTGGIPRTVMVLLSVFQAMASDSAEEHLKEILDNHTPLYKHLLDDLEPIEQDVIHALAISYDAISVQEIVNATELLKSDVVRCLIKLEHANLVELQNLPNSESLYFLKERFLNIWYLMRYAGESKERVRWMVRFLEAWCNDQVLGSRVGVDSILRLDPDAATPILQYIIKTLFTLRRIEPALCIEVNRNIRHMLTSESLEFDIAKLSSGERRLFEEGNAFFRKNDFYHSNLCLIRVCSESIDVSYRLAIGFYFSNNSELASKYFEQAYLLDRDSEKPRYLALQKALEQLCAGATARRKLKKTESTIAANEVFESGFLDSVENDPGSTFYLELMMDVEDSKLREDVMAAAIERGCFPILTSIACSLFRAGKEKEAALEFARTSLAVMSSPHPFPIETFTHYRNDLIVRKFSIHMCALALLWNGQVEQAIVLAKETLSCDQFLEAYYYNAGEYNSIGAPAFLYLLLASPNAKYARELFTQIPDLSARFYHIYCTAVRILGVQFFAEGRGVREGWGGVETVNEINYGIGSIQRIYFPETC